ncbi:hypothetical protein [Acetobacter lambici]|uniref:TubC N-terminal docking domain-containing protein n=1 Tax=Acetobacter lambici TaxID=1332824 RepID=A0ABT1F126_9PROT|nr:hypothetical protein [Acetobacter lambici]MCP1242737.1 hypothetical protein [Acetobacter lambici]MCP1258890.1 hypothetical protein [Acetobacter lambici]
MVSHALLDLFSQHDGRTAGMQPKHRPAEVPPPVAHDVAGLLREVERLGCRIDLVDGQPVLKGNGSAIPSAVMGMLRENRTLIIDHLARTDMHTSDCALHVECEQSGIRRNPETGKLHLFGDPSPHWLQEQGWEWNERRRRFTAPYPFDREDPRPRDMIGGGPCLPADFPNIILEPQNVGAA